VVLQAALQKEREATQELLAKRDRQAAEKERELEERTARMLEEERARNDMQNRVMYELLVVSFFYILAKSCT
jgi:tRNA(Ile2) C34 agmatinyltransferase TiaS